MSIKTYYCRDNCCKVLIQKYLPENTHKKTHSNYRKAGVFIYDPKEDSVLLVQSRGHLWGPPKGTLKIGEQNRHCAIREVKEETGLTISSENFSKALKIGNRAIYYYLEMDKGPIEIQDIQGNDANGITWIKIQCLENAIFDGNIVLNHYAKIVFSKFLKKKFKKSDWIVVRKKSSKRC